MLLLCVSPFTYNISKLFQKKKNYEGTTKSKATNQLSTSREGTSQDEILDHDSDLDDTRKKNNSLEGDSSLHIGTKRC